MTTAITVETLHEYIEEYLGDGDEVTRLVRMPLSAIEMPTYQRDRKQPFIGKLASEWDATAYAFPIVALFKGRYIDLDGQQRLAAREQRGETDAVVLLVEGIRTRERLADVFLKINRDRKLLHAFEKYVGAIAARDRGTLEIEKIVAEFDLEVSKSATANGKIPAGAVTQIHVDGGGDLLHRTLLVREMAWGGLGAREANEGKTLLGLATFLRKNWDKIDDDRLVAVLHRQHPGFILSAVERHRGERISYADYLKEHYNKGLRGSKKL